MGKIKDITGRKKGRLTAIRFARREMGKTYWLFKCDCGNEVEKDTHKVGNGVNSCGCLLKERLNRPQPKRLPKGQAEINVLYRRYRAAARRRNIGFNISKKHFKELLTEKCHYCGNAPSLGYLRDFPYNGIDRKNNSRGYSKKNCVTCCGVCNRLKMTFDYNFFLNLIERIFFFKMQETLL